MTPRKTNSVLLALTLGAVCVLAATTISAQLKTPADWKWRFDGPGSVVDADKPKPTETYFVAMPPGFHVTTGPATLLYHPDYQTKGNFAVEAEIFLFPGTSQDEYGVFLGGKGLSPSETPTYVAFVARRDGKGAIVRRDGTAIVDWKANEGILPHPGGDGTAKNILRVDAGVTDITFSANGKEVAKIPRTGLNLDGHFGFRFGKDINVHASRLDVTHKLAPVPVKK